MSATTPTTTARSRRPLWLAIGGLLTLAVAGALAAYLLFFAGEPPSSASIDNAAGVLQSSEPAATTPASTESSDPSESTDPTASTGSAGGVDGTWTVDSSIGSFADYTNAWAGFRVDEELAQGIGNTTAIGRTPGVSGSLTLDGQTLTAVEIEVDLTQIESDRPRRDDAIQRTLSTSQFPTATFVLSQPVDLGSVPADGETVSVTAVGDLTIHGVTKPVSFALDAKLVGDTIVVVGTAPFAFSDYGMQAPTAPIVVSVSDSGTLELQLFFTRS